MIAQSIGIGLVFLLLGITLVGVYRVLRSLFDEE